MDNNANTIQQSPNHLMEQAMSDPQYRGKHVIVVAGQIFTANTGGGTRL